MPKCDFSKVALKLYIEIALRHDCFPVNLLHIFRTPFSKNTSVGLHLQWDIFTCSFLENIAQLTFNDKFYYNLSNLDFFYFVLFKFQGFYSFLANLEMIRQKILTEARVFYTCKNLLVTAAFFYVSFVLFLSRL